MSGRTLAARGLWLFVCGFLPLVALYFVIAPVAFGDREAIDFHFNYYYAAEAIRAGESFYPTDGFIVRGADDLIVDYVYPPLVARRDGAAHVPARRAGREPVPVLPRRSLRRHPLGPRGARLALLRARLPLASRDRCHPTGNVSLLLGFAAALVWRYRDVAPAAGASLGVSIAAKIFLWPLTIWLAATRRVAAAAWSIGVALAVLLASWAVVGFRGLGDYPELVRRLSDRMDERGYTVYALGVDLGLSIERRVGAVAGRRGRGPGVDGRARSARRRDARLRPRAGRDARFLADRLAALLLAAPRRGRGRPAADRAGLVHRAPAPARDHDGAPTTGRRSRPPRCSPPSSLTFVLVLAPPVRDRRATSLRSPVALRP